MDLLSLDQTAAREQSYPDTVGKLLGAFSTEAVKADAFAKDAALARAITILNRPNVKWVAGGKLLGSDEVLAAGGSVPAMLASDMRVFAPSTATISGSMRVSESNKAISSEQSKGSFSATAKWGIGMFSISGTAGGSMSSSTKQTRSTDYSAKVEWEMKFAQGPPPEGIAMICETTQDIINTVNQINIARANAQKQALADGADDNPKIDDPDERESFNPSDDKGGDKPDPKPENGGGN